VTVFAPDSEEITFIEISDQVTNLEWGGPNLSDLYMTTPSTVYRLKMAVTGFKK
jgi:sugar lactone lactonase YvrE